MCNGGITITVLARELVSGRIEKSRLCFFLTVTASPLARFSVAHWLTGS
jgi:hypothetical protein